MTLAWASKASKIIILALWALIVSIPLLILVTVTVKSPQDLLHTTLGLPKVFMWSNFAEAWRTANLGMAFGNSILITGLRIVGIVFASSFAAYPLARVKSSLSSSMFLFYIGYYGSVSAKYDSTLQTSEVFTFDQYASRCHSHFHCNVDSIFHFSYTGFLKGIPKELEEVGANGMVVVHFERLRPLFFH